MTSWSPNETALELVDRVAADSYRRVQLYRRLGIVSLLGTTVPTAAIPVCLVAAHRFAPWDLVPSMLAALSLVAGALTFHVRPFERLRMLRESHIVLAAERQRFVHRMTPYDSEERESVFLETLEGLRRHEYVSWAGLLPRSDQVGTPGPR